MNKNFLHAILTIVLVDYTWGFPHYQQSIPNGENIIHEGKSWPAVGHRNRNSGSGPENPFGVAFAAAGRAWTQELCEADSDSDGQSNGQELGDPNCTWTPGQTPSRIQGISHPGFAEKGGATSVFDLGSALGPISIGFIAGLVAITITGVLVTHCCGSRLSRKLFRPVFAGWNFANIFAVTAVFVGLIICSRTLGSIGAAAGLASALPIWWSFFKVGVHNMFGMSREAAWRIHIAFGNIALLLGLIHGVLSILVNGIAILDNIVWTLGLGGLFLMLLGIIPAFVHAIAPKIVTYDRMKVLHFASLIGYLLIFVHMLGNANDGSIEAIPIAGFSAIALVAYVLQRLYLMFHAWKITSLEADVISEQCAQHVMLRLKVPGFKYAPGQWCLLKVPSLSAVAHPFTIVPDKTEEHVQLFTKVSGQFTSQLADACMSGTNGAPAMRLQGPYGNPPLPANDIDAVIFVLGGVGVTPALSLVAEANKLCGDQVHVYWNLRSMELLKRAAPFLEPHLKPELQCIRITKTPESTGVPIESGPKMIEPAPQVSSAVPDPVPAFAPQSINDLAKKGLQLFQTTLGVKAPDAKIPSEADPPAAEKVERLPLGAEIGREDVDKWISIVASDLVAKGSKRALLFVCGPAELVCATQQASTSSERATGIAWQLHVEQFQFLSTSGSKKLSQLRFPRCSACRYPQQKTFAKDADVVFKV